MRFITVWGSSIGARFPSITEMDHGRGDWCGRLRNRSGDSIEIVAENSFSRRHFFFGSLLAGAVPTAGFGSVASLKHLGYKSPNEKLNYAAIGSGGKGYSDIKGVTATENLVAMADADEKRASRAFNEFPNVPKYKDFRKMLDKEEEHRCGNGLDS